MIIIPNRDTKTLVQVPDSKILGDFWSTFNIDIQSDPGIIKVSPRMKLAESSATETNMGLACAFRHFDERLFTIAGSRVFYTTDEQMPNSVYTEDSSSGAQTNYDSRWSDMEVFNDALYTTTVDELLKKTYNGNGTGAWSIIDSAFASETTPHPLCYFNKHNRLYYADSDFVASINDTDTISSGSYEVDLQINWREVITCMKATSSSIFIGTSISDTGSNSSNMKGAVYEWDGISAQVTKKYEINANGVVSMIIDNDKPYIMDSNGILREFTGYSFKEIGKLPYKRTYPINSSSITGQKFIHQNGLIVSSRGTFLVLVNNKLGDSSSSILENFPSGIWEWSPKNGFVHKHSITYTSSSTITDYGQNTVLAVGALFEYNRYNTSSSRNGEYIAGVNYYSNASSSLFGIFYDDSNNTLQKYGYFVTSWLITTAIKDNWKKLAVRFRQLLDSSDKIILKYRRTEEAPIYIDITWNDTTSFHTTTDVDDYVGYEVEILQGVGSGKTFHVTSISGSSPWKMNLDETLTGATGTAKARLQNWKKAVSISNQNIESHVITIGEALERIQIKCCMQFTGDDELHELIVMNSQHTKLE